MGVPALVSDPVTCTELALSAAVLLSLTICSALFEAMLLLEEPPQPVRAASPSRSVEPVSRSHKRTMAAS
jgi:hypothetical protein